MLKRVVSTLLTLVMVFSLIPMNIIATTEEIYVPETTAPTEGETAPEETVPEETVLVTETIACEVPDSYNSDVVGIEEGACGPNATFSLNIYTGLLTISGSGEMWSLKTKQYWDEASVKKIIVEPGITKIGDYAFDKHSYLTEIVIPETLTAIGEQAFFNCRNLESIYLPKSITSIKSDAFWYCYGLTDIYYGGSEADWEAAKLFKSPDRYNNATVHFNSTGPAIPDEPEVPDDGDTVWEVRYYLDWEEAEQRAYFGPDGLIEDASAVSDETDSAFLADPTALQGGYVLVETKQNGDEEILISMVKPESYVCTVTSVSSGGIMLGDAVYPMDGGIEALEGYLGKKVLYHIYLGELVGIEILQEKTGFLTYWHRDAKQLWIQSNETATDSKVYTLFDSIPEDSRTFLYEFVAHDCATDVTVNYLANSCRHIFAITPYVEYRPEGFSEEKHGWPIVNSRSSFGYPTGYAIEPWVYYAHGHSIESIYHENRTHFRSIPWNGSCFGLSVLAVAQYAGLLDLKPYFTQGSGSLNSFGYNSVYNPGDGDRCVLYDYESGHVVYNSAIIQKIEQAQVGFYSSEQLDIKKEIHNSDFLTFVEYLQGENPVPLVVGMPYIGHAVVIDTSIKPIYIGSGQYLIPLYDSNAPQAPVDMAQPWKNYDYNQSMLYLDIERECWGYWYNNEWYKAGGYDLIQSELEIHNIYELDQSFFDSRYSFDSEYHTFVFNTSELIEIIKIDSATGEHITVFKLTDGVPNVNEIFGELLRYYEGVDGKSTIHTGGVRLQAGDYIIRAEGESYIQCMYDNNIFVIGTDQGVEARLESGTDEMTVSGIYDDTDVSVVHASSDVDFCTSVASTIRSKTSISLSADSKTKTAAVETNMDPNSITLQHAVDGELVDITPKMIHQHQVMTHMEAVAPTLETTGQIEHYICQCGTLFADADCSTELAPEDVILEKLTGVAAVNGTGYNTLAEALDAAAKGDTVLLMQDAAEDTVTVFSDITLDLNGYSLTADYVFAVKGSNIVDNSADNTGILLVNPDQMMVSSSNSDLPVWTGEGFIFIDVLKFQEMYRTTAQGQKQYIFSPTFETIAHQYLMQGMENSRVKIAIRMTWEIDTGSAFQNFVFNDKTVKDIIGSFNGKNYTQAFYATITNSEYADFALQVVLISDTGVELACN